VGQGRRGRGPLRAVEGDPDHGRHHFGVLVVVLPEQDAAPVQRGSGGGDHQPLVRRVPPHGAALPVQDDHPAQGLLGPHDAGQDPTVRGRPVRVEVPRPQLGQAGGYRGHREPQDPALAPRAVGLDRDRAEAVLSTVKSRPLYFLQIDFLQFSAQPVGLSLKRQAYLRDLRM